MAADQYRNGLPMDRYIARMNSHLKWVRDHMAGGNDHEEYLRDAHSRKHGGYAGDAQYGDRYMGEESV
jgi:hypothetical protein